MIVMGNTNAFTIQEISAMFDVTPQTIRRYVNEGRITAVKFGGKWVITEDAMKDFLMNRSPNKKETE